MRTLSLLLIVGAAYAQSSAQSPPSTPIAFEVASVKPNTSGSARSDWDRDPSGRVTLINVTLRHLIRDAYGVIDSQIAGGPAWLDVDRFDVIAKPPDGSQAAQSASMMKALLAERFRLVTHTERRELPVYELLRVTPEALGPRLRPRPDCAGRQPGAGDQSEPPCGGFLFGPNRVTMRGMGIGALASHLSTERFVLDRTGLSGDVDVDLEWATEGPSLFTALQEQLGLRLQPTRAMVDVLVIDAAQRPSAN